MKQKIIYIVVALLLSGFFAGSVFAADMYFKSADEVIAPNAPFVADLLLDSNVPVNALSVTVPIPSHVEVKEIRNGNSVINFWIEQPTFDAKTRAVTFSGIIPGGFVFKKGNLITLILETKETKPVTLTVDKAKSELLRNDVPGETEVVRVIPLSLTLSADKKENTGPQGDTEIPESFKPIIAQDPELFEGKWVVVFSAQDKGSGIKTYEVQETTKRKPADDRWVDAQSPHILEDQTASSRVFVKAVDNNGNIRVVYVDGPNKTAWYSNYTLWFIIILILAVVFFVYMKKRNTTSRIVTLGLLVLAFFAHGLVAEAATLFVSSPSSTYNVGQTFSATIQVESVSQSVNAVASTLTYPADKLEIISVSKDGSLINLWAEEPAYSNSRGTLSFEGVMLSSVGYQGSSGRVISILFRAKAPGTALVAISKGSVLANDGRGSETFTGSRSALITLVARPVETPKVETPAPTPIEETPTPTVTATPKPIVITTPTPAPIDYNYWALILLLIATILLFSGIDLALWIRLKRVERTLAQVIGRGSGGGTDAKLSPMRSTMVVYLAMLERAKLKRQLTAEEDELAKFLKKELEASGSPDKNIEKLNS